jgi:DNA-directed RNA polymerase subunit RPC12/RpoP
METLGDNLGVKKGKKSLIEYVCIYCDFKCFKKYSWDRHLITTKHKKLALGDILVTEKGVKYNCETCNKEYTSRNGLWKHRQKCKNDKNNHDIKNDIKEFAKNITDKDELILLLIKENSEFKNIIMEQQNMMMKVLENVTNTNINNSVVNNS